MKKLAVTVRLYGRAHGVEDAITDVRRRLEEMGGFKPEDIEIIGVTETRLLEKEEAEKP